MNSGSHDTVAAVRTRPRDAVGGTAAPHRPREARGRGWLLWTAFGVALATAIGSAAVSWAASREAAEANRIARDQTSVAESADVRETLIAATARLNASTPEDRTVGVLLLGRVDRESPSYRPEVRQLLATFVRWHAKAPTPMTYQPNADVHQAMRILGQAGAARGEEPVDLSNAYLGYEDVSHLQLSDVNLSRSVLVETDLRGTALHRTSLEHSFVGRSAKLEGADFTGANLRCAVFDGTDLSRTVGLTTEQLATAVLKNKPALPPGVRAPATTPAECG